MKFKELLKTIKYNVINIELYNQKSQMETPFYTGNPIELPLSTYLDIEDAEVLEINVVPENNDCVMLIRIKGTWGERE